MEARGALELALRVVAFMEVGSMGYCTEDAG